MSTVSKILTLLIMGALLVLLVHNPGGSSQLMSTGGGVLDNTLAIEAGGSPSAAASMVG